MCKTNSFRNRLYVLLSFVYVIFTFNYALFSFGYALFSFKLYVLFIWLYALFIWFVLFSFCYVLFPLFALFMCSVYVLFSSALLIFSFHKRQVILGMHKNYYYTKINMADNKMNDVLKKLGLFD